MKNHSQASNSQFIASRRDVKPSPKTTSQSSIESRTKSPNEVFLKPKSQRQRQYDGCPAKMVPTSEETFTENGTLKSEPNLKDLKKSKMNAFSRKFTKIGKMFSKHHDPKKQHPQIATTLPIRTPLKAVHENEEVKTVSRPTTLSYRSIPDQQLEFEPSSADNIRAAVPEILQRKLKSQNSNTTNRSSHSAVQRKITQAQITQHQQQMKNLSPDSYFSPDNINFFPRNSTTSSGVYTPTQHQHQSPQHQKPFLLTPEQHQLSYPHHASFAQASGSRPTSGYDSYTGLDSIGDNNNPFSRPGSEAWSESIHSMNFNSMNSYTTSRSNPHAQSIATIGSMNSGGNNHFYRTV